MSPKLRAPGPVLSGPFGVFCAVVLLGGTAAAQDRAPVGPARATVPPATATATALAPPPDREPVYSDDPFGDADLADVPLIMNVAHPTARRFDLTLAFATSLVDKYVQQTGAALDLRYHVADHWGIGATLSFFGGGLTDIVTDGAGVLGNKVTACRTVNASVCDLSLGVPDTKQMTGSVDFTAIWLPFYGKVNLVSELDFDMQLYLLAGGGVNGTRLITADYDPSSPTGYVLSGGKAGEGGMFANAVPHVTIGAGATIFLNRWLALRGEYRGIIWRQSLDNDGDGTFEPSTSWRNIAMVGLVVSQ